MAPVIGGPALELFNAVIAPPLQRRQFEWMESLASSLKQLEERQQCIVEELSENEAFIDTVMQASQAAIQTNNQEKLDALRNAVMNSALPAPPEESKRQIFVALISQMSVWHLRILTLLADPPKWFSENDKPVPRWSMTSSISQLITTAYPELASERDFYGIIGKDLYQRGLLNSDGFHTMMSGQGALEKRGTRFAEEFLKFISSP